MALEPIQQIEKIIDESKNVLIILPQNPNGDAIGSGWAFYFFLEKKGIVPTLAFVDEFKEAERFIFLPKPKNISESIAEAKEFILVFNTKYNKISNVKPEFGEDELKIYITPEKGSIDPRDFCFIPAKSKYDAIVVLDSPDKETLGKVFEDDPDIFYEIPVINIDHHSNNENFGQVNMVNITASSTAEVLYEIFEKIDSTIIDENISDCLLTAIISGTESFQRKNTTPKSLQISAKLMDNGAKQQEIIRWLFKTQPFNTLKLWGRVMARLNWDENLKLVWSLVAIEDFVQSRSNPQDIPFILEKIKDNYSAGNIFMVLYNENIDIVAGMIKCASPEMAKKLSGILDGQIKQDIVIFRIEKKNILEVEKEVLEKLRK
ncbi:MAG: DHH family phosphoesterase [Parcubacteria group bacterium]|jgi:nanoRNase/pAp phosphatase (c-di-AMP/oligoRNAs hydrolase)